MEAVLQEDLGDDADVLIGNLGTRYHFRLAMLQYPMRAGKTEELRWFVSETDALTRFRLDAPPAMRRQLIGDTKRWVMSNLRKVEAPLPIGSSRSVNRRGLQLLADLITHFGKSSVESWSERTWEAFSLQALWRISRLGAHTVGLPSAAKPAPRRHRDLLLEATSVDSDMMVHDVLIRFCAAFLDQGMAPWKLPNREKGFYAAFRALYGEKGGPPDAWMESLPHELARIERAKLSPLESIIESLSIMGIAESEWNESVSSTLLALRGWAGMIRQMELRADRVAIPAPEGSLDEFLAVYLILDRLALSYVARQELQFVGPLSELPSNIHAHLSRSDVGYVEQRAFQILQLAQVRAWHPSSLVQFSKREWSVLVHEIESFHHIERRRLLHRAYERRFRLQTLDAISIYNEDWGRKSVAGNANGDLRRPTPALVKKIPRFQVLTCIDDREESFRRHLIEVSPESETFGVAGFFNAPIYYRGAGDANFVPLCPIIIRPQHWVVEDVVEEHLETHRRRAKTRKALGAASHRMHLGSRGFASGALLTAGLGVLASVPLLARVLFPRMTALLRRSAGRLVRPPAATTLRLERSEPLPGPGIGQIGFQVDEMANIAERMLRDVGLTSGFARLVAIIGHGSNSLNNPHKSAYDCGACGGGAGGPNARAVSQMLNDPRVRALLAERGLLIPEETKFVGGFHNTCDDSVTFFDLNRLPTSHQKDIAELNQVIDETCERNAHERCRRFQSAPLNLSISAAHRHVEGRSEDLAQNPT